MSTDSTIDSVHIAPGQFVQITWPARRVWLGALFVSLTYYLAVEVGLALTFQPHPVSVLWPANAVLLAALLVAPTSAWPILLLAALPPHLIAELSGGVPLRMILSWYVSNCSEALIGAYVIRRLNPEPLRLDTVRGLGLFIAVCAFLGPFLSSFLDAALVTLNHWGDSGYWTVWRLRFLSNMLATQILVPIVLETRAETFRAARSLSPGRRIEATLLAASVLFVCIVAFLGPVRWTALGPVRIYAPLPLLLWAAVRFGSYGVALSLATVAVTSIWGAIHGNGPFAGLSPSDNALSIQIFLVLIAPSLSMVATLIAERARTIDELRESRRAEQAKLDDDERMAAAAASVNIGFWSYEMPTHRLWVTDQYRSTFGLNADVLLSPATGLSMIHSDDRDAAMRVFVDLARTGAPLDTEFRVVRPDGATRHLAVSGRVERDPSDDVRRVTGVAIDITDRRRAEWEAAQRRRELEHLGRVATVGELSGALAHELAQPLTAIMSNAQVARRLLQRDPVDVPLLQEILADIVRDDRRGANVIGHLRDLLRNQETTRTPIDLRDVAQNMLALERSDLIEHRIDVSTRFTDEATVVLGDRVQLEQVLLNLIINARDSLDGVPVPSRRLRVEIERIGCKVQLSVIDSGIGVPRENLRLVFESFYTTKVKGIGLGLPICQAIVTDHGGRLWIESDGHGATLFMSLPSITPEAGGGDTVDRASE